VRIDMVSEHASPLATPSGADAGGQSGYVRELSSALAARGHEIVVWTRRSDRTSADVVRMCPRVRVRQVRAGPPVAVPKDELVPHLPEFTERLRRSWARERPDVAHAHSWMSGMAALAAAGPLQVPMVQTFHTLGSVERRHRGAEDTSPAGRVAAEQVVGRRADRIIATCTDEVFELARMRIPRDRTSVVSCGVDVEQFTPRGPAAERGDRPRIVVLGRLVRPKGVDEAVEAMRLLAEAELVVAGGSGKGDPDAARLAAHAERHGVADRVRLLGPVPHPEVPTLLRSADVVVCVPWYEPFGTVALEAMACARPVVGAAVGGIVDTVVDGVTGALVPSRRPDLLAGALRELLASPTKAMSWGIAGRDRAMARFRWDRVAAGCVDVYRAAVEARSGSHRAAAGANR